MFTPHSKWTDLLVVAQTFMVSLLVEAFSGACKGPGPGLRRCILLGEDHMDARSCL